MILDENLAAVHAYLCGDGYVIKNPETQKKKYYMIGLRNTEGTLLKDFQKRFEVVFGKRPYITNEGRCRISSKEIYERLARDFGSFYSYEWEAPELSKDCSKIWLRALFDCEGWVTCESRKNRMIGLDCVNKKGIFQVKYLLKGLGIECKTRNRKERGIFSLSIFGKENLIKFRDDVGFLHPSKKEKLEEVMADFVNYCWEFPSGEASQKKFIKNLLIGKATIKADGWVIRLVSNKKKNLIKLQYGLNVFFDVESKVSNRRNGAGTMYYELNINKKEEVRKLVKHNMINKDNIKWSNLKKLMI